MNLFQRYDLWKGVNFKKQEAYESRSVGNPIDACINTSKKGKNRF